MKMMMSSRRLVTRCLFSTTSTTSDEALKMFLKDQLKVSMRSKEKMKVGVIKSVLADIITAEKSGQTMPSISLIIQKGIKKRSDSIESYTQGGRLDLVALEQEEKILLESFLPKQLSKEEITSIVKSVVESGEYQNIKQLGQLMKELVARPDLSDSVASKKLVSQVAKEVLTTSPK